MEVFGLHTKQDVLLKTPAPHHSKHTISRVNNGGRNIIGIKKTSTMFLPFHNNAGLLQ